ncbi:MAG: hypothetical protein HKN40_03875 [Winogradskyella sp.]|uniref:hypothetical protein n=1 Tax=Winogradskyella sp. TaxID=1883156 RepID=UPI0017AB8FC7|nr:hypothetical protein [Winogradskyella sp.]
MRQVIETEGVKFWKEESIIHCKLESSFFSLYDRVKTEELFINAIVHLNNSNYMPFLIDLEGVSNSHALKIYNLIASSTLIDSNVLTKTFFVPSFRAKLLLAVRTFIDYNLVPNKVLVNHKKAINYCQRDYQLFYQIS